MEHEKQYLETKALWDKLIALTPPMDENYKFTGEFTREFTEARQQLEREHIESIGYLLGYAEDLLKRINELEGKNSNATGQ